MTRTLCHASTRGMGYCHDTVAPADNVCCRRIARAAAFTNWGCAIAAVPGHRHCDDNQRNAHRALGRHPHERRKQCMHACITAMKSFGQA
eukprot:365940-Chlamydomonas_euryale.AAC.27